ncbi:CHAP domain-containing protein [bacterium]|nr:MAG: CHAP domain-containing protein [bacterium]
MKFKDTAIDIAGSQEGQKESPVGSNKGPMVTQYQRCTGYPKGGVAWCLCFCYWCIDEACQRFGIVNPVLKTGGCDQILSWAKSHNLFHTTPEVGDIGLVLAAPGSSDAVHAFMVSEVSGGQIGTIEGNSNKGGGREGYIVVRRKRPQSTKIVYVRWADLSQFKNLKEEPEPLKEMKMVVVAEKEFGQCEVVDGATWVPVRKLLEAVVPDAKKDVLNTLAWDADDQTLKMGDRLFAGQVFLRDGSSYAPIRKIVDFANAVFGTHLAVALAGEKVLVA